MLSKTSVSAMRALTFLGLKAARDPISPRVIAAHLGESPTYLAKILRHLVKAGILKSHRGIAGGVTLNRRPEEISLLRIVEACQGEILADFCDGGLVPTQTCAFHQAAEELHSAIVGVLSRWTLAHLLQNPHPAETLSKSAHCWLDVCERVEGSCGYDAHN